MDFPHILIRFSGNDGAGMQPFAVREVFPAFPSPREHERRIVLHADRVGNFAAGNPFPFIEAVTWNQATSFIERLAK